MRKLLPTYIFFLTLHNTNAERAWVKWQSKAGIELSSQEHQPVEARPHGTGLVLWEGLGQLQTPLILCYFILGLIKAHVSHWLHSWDTKGKQTGVITQSEQLPSAMEGR